MFEPPAHYGDLDLEGHDGQLEDTDPRPWVSLGVDQAVRLSRIREDHPKDTLVLFDQRAGYVLVARYGVEGELLDWDLLPPVG